MNNFERPNLCEELSALDLYFFHLFLICFILTRAYLGWQKFRQEDKKLSGSEAFQRRSDQLKRVSSIPG